MGTSLRDQLLKAGLVNKDQVRQAEKQRRKQQGSPAATAAAQKQAAEAARAHAAKIARDQDLNRRNAAQVEAKARDAQVRQIIEQNRLPKSESDDYYSFQDGKHVRRIAIDAGQRGQLSRGELVIARYDKSYALLPAAVAARVRERNPDAVIDVATARDGGNGAPDDAYQGFDVPDDLVW